MTMKPRSPALDVRPDRINSVLGASEALLLLVGIRRQPRVQADGRVLRPRTFRRRVDMNDCSARYREHLPGRAVADRHADHAWKLHLAAPGRLPHLIGTGIGKGHPKRRTG